MKKLRKMLVMAGCVAALSLSANSLMAQGQGQGRGGDPAQFRQRAMDRYKEALEVTDDAEWKVLEAAIGKVMDARQELGGGFGGRGGRGGRGGNNNGGADQGTTAAGGQGGQNRRGPGGGTPSPEAEALQAAIDAKAPADEIKAKLGKLRDANKAKEAKLASAQADLQKLLSARQEASAVMLGLLK
ncbi:MAG: hypothetical protein JWR26_2511 [Pedosphaera sp.]|nr:hypothetical protein [Pedosphaera sp.]